MDLVSIMTFSPNQIIFTNKLIDPNLATIHLKNFKGQSTNFSGALEGLISICKDTDDFIAKNQQFSYHRKVSIFMSDGLDNNPISESIFDALEDIKMFKYFILFNHDDKKRINGENSLSEIAKRVDGKYISVFDGEKLSQEFISIAEEMQQTN